MEREFMTEEEALAAVRQCGMALRLVPDGLKTEAVCIAAAAEDCNALEFVPEDRRTPELYRAVVRSWGLPSRRAREAMQASGSR